MNKEAIAQLSQCTLRLLQAYGIKDDQTYEEAQELVQKTFSKKYTLPEIKKVCKELVALELLAPNEENNGKHTITHEGKRVVGKIHKHADKEPDPWRRFTRPSYSPNVAVQSAPQHAF